jgi:hypothetical protein
MTSFPKDTWLSPAGWADLRDRLARARADGKIYMHVTPDECEALINEHDERKAGMLEHFAAQARRVLLSRDPSDTRLVHLLYDGRALCPLEGAPGDWPKGHAWVDLADDCDAATCPNCLKMQAALAEGGAK